MSKVDPRAVGIDLRRNGVYLKENYVRAYTEIICTATIFCG